MASLCYGELWWGRRGGGFAVYFKRRCARIYFTFPFVFISSKLPTMRTKFTIGVSKYTIAVLRRVFTEEFGVNGSLLSLNSFCNMKATSLVSSMYLFSFHIKYRIMAIVVS